MFSSSSLCNDKDAMWWDEYVRMFSSSSLCNDKDAMLRRIREDVFKFFLCNDKDAMLRLQC